MKELEEKGNLVNIQQNKIINHFQDFYNQIKLKLEQELKDNEKNN